MDHEPEKQIAADAVAKRDAGRHGTLLILAILFFAHGWFTLGPNLSMLNVNHFDAWSQLPWMYRWADPELFPDDLMADYFQRYHVPPGLRAEYYTLMQWLGIELNIASRIVAVGWYALTFVMFLAVVGRALPGRPWTITLAAVATTLVPFHLTTLMGYSIFSRFDGGLARAAGAAVLLATIYGVARPSRLAHNLAIIAGAAFYPPACVIAVVTAGLAAAFAGSWRKMIAECAGLLPGAILAGTIVWLWYPLDIDSRFGPLVGREDISWAPEIALLHFPTGQTPAAVFIGWCQASSAACLALLVQALVYRGGRLLFANTLMLVAGLVSTMGAYWLWPELYEIDRYQLWPRCVVLFVAVAAVLAKLGEVISTRSSCLTTGQLAWLALAGYLAFDIALTEYRRMRAKPDFARWASVGGFGRRVIDLLAASPKETRVASLGDELDGVPTFSKRSLLLLPSAMCPYHRQFHREVVKRYLTIQDAVYATDLEPIIRLRDEYKVRYLSVNRARFDPAQFERLVGSPLAKVWLPNRVEPILKLGVHGEFVLNNVPEHAVVINDGDYQLIDLDRLP